MGVTLGATSFRPIFVGFIMDKNENVEQSQKRTETIKETDLAKNDGPKDVTVMEEAGTSKTPQMIVLELEKTLGRNLPRKLSLNLGQTRLGGTYSTPTSPVPASPSYNTGCVNLKWDESAGRSKYKAGDYTSESGRIAPMTSTSTPGKPKAIQTAKLETPAAYLTPKIQERQIKKRKAAASPSPNEEAAKIGNPNKRVIDRLCMQISKLGRIVGETYHPKKELKSVAESLASLTAQLQSGNSNEDSSCKEIARLIEKVNAEVQVDVEGENSKDAEGLREKFRTAEQNLRALREENDALRKSLQEKRPTQDAAVQVDLNSELRTCETGAWSNSTNELKTLEKTDTFEQWGAIASKKWREDLFTNTVVVVGTPFETKDDVTKVVLVEPEDGIWSIQRAFRERYPELRFFEQELDVVEQKLKSTSRKPRKWDGCRLRERPRVALKTKLR
jgi:hypothetical protein